MNFFEKLLLFLKGTMTTPTSYGWFHLMWIILVIISIILLYNKKKKHSEKKLKIVLFTYGIIALILELLKQLIWSFNYDSITNVVTWDYQWYAFPFQLCTTPIFVSLICTFIKDGKVRNSLLSYMAFITILGSIVTVLMPDSCFTSDILVNIHTMWLHCGSLVISVYILITNKVELNLNNIKKAIKVFIIFVGLALCLNILIYNTGILNGETFNMFYISPYFDSTLPVFDIIYKYVPYIVFLIIYIWIIIIGAFIIYGISKLINYIIKRKNLFNS